MRSASEILRQFGLPPPPPGSHRYYVKCPKCSASRKTAAHRAEKKLGITIESDCVSFGCNHCGWKGGAKFIGNGQDRDPVAAIYEYQNEAGQVLSRKVRTAGKKFWQQRPNGRGGWINGTASIRRVLYRLPELIEAIAAERTLLVVEGEKDVDNLSAISVPATCNCEGASKPGQKSKWRAEYSESLRGADVVIIADNDAPGQYHAAEIVKALAGIARRVRLLDLQKYWPDCPESGDISDWLKAGNTREQLDDLIAHLEDDLPRQTENVARSVLLDPRDPIRSARELVAAHFMDNEGRRILHRHRGSFWKFQGNCYRFADEEAMRAVTWNFLEAAESMGKNGPVSFRPTRARVSDVLDAAASVCNLDSVLEPPIWLDGTSDFFAAELFPVANGLLHLPTGNLISATPFYFGLAATDVKFDPNVLEPRHWMKFLNELFEGDDEAIATLKEWFGYVLSPDTAQQKILLIVGPTRSGKGTIARVCTGLVGRDNVAAPTLAALQTNFGLAPLIGKPLAIISDARLGGRSDQAAIAERLLSISGEDALTIDRKFQTAWTGRLPTRFMLLTNELPRLSDTSGALAKRFIVLVLERSFYGREDPGLTARLLAELPAVLNWARQGYEQLSNRGYFVQPTSGRDAIEELEALGSPVTAFGRERCIIGAGQEIPTDLLFQAWRQWCENNGRREHGTVQTFGRDLRAAYSGVKTRQKRESGDRERVYAGISLR